MIVVRDCDRGDGGHGHEINRTAFGGPGVHVVILKSVQEQINCVSQHDQVSSSKA